jgi:H+/Cl- antiporter ClcA
MSSLASVLAAVRMAEWVSQVYPISQASGWRRAWRACADGHDQRSRFQKRVEPMTVFSLWLTIAKGTAVPASRQSSAVLM